MADWQKFLPFGCPKVNEANNISNHYADVQPAVYIFSDLKADISNNCMLRLETYKKKVRILA